jgi:hypothetical protein
VSECVPEIGTELHRERLLSKLLDEAVVDGDPQTILLFKGVVRAAGEEDEGEVGTLGECATSGEAITWLQQNWKMGSMLADQICHNVRPGASCAARAADSSHHDGMAGGERCRALHGWTGTENAPTQRDGVPRQVTETGED